MNTLAPDDFTAKRKKALEKLDNEDFSSLHIRICLVAGGGFLTDGYTLYAVLFVFPMLAYAYADDTSIEHFRTMIKTSTWFGSLLGHLLFGYMTDIYGRRKVRIRILILTCSINPNCACFDYRCLA